MKRKVEKIKKNRGFSVVELIVVISIFVIMLSVSMFSYQDTSKKVEATNLAEDIALTMRQAQVYGLSASEKILAGENFDEVEYFDAGQQAKDITEDHSVRGIAIVLGENKIYLFQDVDQNFAFSDDDIILDERKIYSPDVSIESVIVCNNGNCSEKEGNGDTLSIAFQRPYPDAYVVYTHGQFSSLYDRAEILISDAKNGDVLRKIAVNSAGNIYVKNS